MSSNLERIINNPSAILENCNTAEPEVIAFSDGSSSLFDHHHHHQQQQRQQQRQQRQLCMIFNNYNDNKNIQSSGGLTADAHLSHAVESFVNLPSTPPVPATGLRANNKKSLMSGRKRKRSNEKVMMEKPKEVIHVRAKRGQATDSHSLAERVRREKINERLRSLQDLVPGCYKTMGMAVMLDVIIKYVRSLQNQIEFLSVKLSAANMYYDFNSELDATETMLGTNVYEVQDIEGMARGGGCGGPSYFHSSWSL